MHFVERTVAVMGAGVGGAGDSLAAGGRVGAALGRVEAGSLHRPQDEGDGGGHDDALQEALQDVARPQSV